MTDDNEEQRGSADHRALFCSCPDYRTGPTFVNCGYDRKTRLPPKLIFAG
jgi:hypothetical protein